jgi:hypothetical protein
MMVKGAANAFAGFFRKLIVRIQKNLWTKVFHFLRLAQSDYSLAAKKRGEQ